MRKKITARYRLTTYLYMANSILQLFLVSLLASVSYDGVAQKIKFMSNGIERSFILHLPAGYSKKDTMDYPLILCLHGKGSNGREMKMYTGLNKTGDELNSIVAYPTTKAELWPYADTSDIMVETTYLMDIIDYLTMHHKADPNRVYMAGMSSGGIFTYTFASRYPWSLKGIAVVSGNITLMAKEDVEHNASILPPLLLIHGTKDEILYNGRAGFCLNAEDSYATYREACVDQSPVTQWMPDLRKDKCTVEKITYNCPGKMIYYRIHNGGHHWPGANFNAALFTSLKLGRYCRDISANDAIKDFILNIEGR